MNNYYEYVYIDPRNFEEFYYGKGKGSRKDAHLSEDSDTEKSKYVALVSWLSTVTREEAKWQSKSGLFTSQLVRAALDAQPETVKFLEKEFNVNFAELMA